MIKIICLLVISLPSIAHAYVDPGSGGAIVAAVLGFIGAIGYTLRKYFYKLKNLFAKKKNDSEK